MRMPAAKMYLFLLGLAVVVMGLSGLMLREISCAKRAERRAWCCSHLKMIATALQNYHDVHGCFPPSCTLDRAGKPMHSWRVLLLPYLGESDLYARYRLDEPWNSENNRRLAKLSTECYRCPADTSAAEGTTSYLAVVGPHAAWRKEKALRMSDITDGISYTIMLVEVSDSGINWMEPRDLSFDEAAARISAGLSPDGKLGIRSRHTSVVNCGFGNVQAHCLEKNISPTLLRGLLTADGREDVSEFFRREEELLPRLIDSALSEL